MARILTRYIRPECFVPDLGEEGREDALRRIVHIVAENGLLKDEKGVVAKLMARELMQSTAVQNGIAVPHCFTDEITDLIVVVARSVAGIDFHSLDGERTHVIFLTIGNPEERGLYLKALSEIARLIKRRAFIEKVASSTTVQEIVRAVHEVETEVLILDSQGGP